MKEFEKWGRVVDHRLKEVFEFFEGKVLFGRDFTLVLNQHLHELLHAKAASQRLYKFLGVEACSVGDVIPHDSVSHLFDLPAL